MSVSFTYTCESCGGEVTMTSVEYHRLPFGKWGARIVCDQCKDAPVQADANDPEPRRTLRPRSMPPQTARLNLKPNERDDYGVTVTIRNTNTDDLETLVGHGPVRDALRQVCDQIDARGDHWKVVTVSSPATIFSDLQGSRDYGNARVESKMLGQIGRTDLLDEDRRVAA